MQKKIVIVGMSGGLDSTMAAYLLKKQGFNVIGVTMRLWHNQFKMTAKKSGCFGPGESKDIASAKAAAKKIKIRHYVLDVGKEYQREVLDYFIKEYCRGRTPNPCVVCNAKIKFGYLLEKLKTSGLKFDFFATGHYAKIFFDKKFYILKKGRDPIKDQSYFLYQLNQNQLSKILFPLGNLTKHDVRKLARKVGFKQYADKAESQNFLECADQAALFKKKQLGDIYDYQGHKIGSHQGIWHYTIGQRRNLHVGGLPQPYYVLKIDAVRNRLIVGPKKLLLFKKMKVTNLNWPGSLKNIFLKNINVKIRYGSTAVPCSVKNRGKTAEVIFASKQFAPTPGQFAVFYRQDTVLGGGVIKESVE